MVQVCRVQMAPIDLDNLTDSEIRNKFIELGSPVGPVTATTRRTLLKKLKTLLDEAGNSSAFLNETATSPVQHNARSDGEQNDGSIRSRRRSLPRSTNKSPKRKSPARVNVTSPQYDYTANFQSPDSASATSSPITNGNKRSSRVSLLQDTTNYSRSSLLDNYDNQKFLAGEVSSTQNYGSVDRVSSRYSALNDSARSRFSDTNNDVDLNLSSNAGTSSPYCSDFLKRLTASRNTQRPEFRSPIAGIASKLLDVKESDDEDSGPPPVYAKFSQNSSKGTPTTSLKNIRRTLPSEGWFPFDSAISTFLLIVFLLFFAAIGITYINMHSTDTGVTSPTDMIFPVCIRMHSQVPGENCILEGDKDIVLKLFHILYKKLYDDMINGPCTDIREKKVLEDDMVTIMVEQDKKISVWVVEQHIKNLRVLFGANPKWKIIPIEGGIIIKDTPLTYYCYIINNIYHSINYVIKIGLSCLLLYGTYVALVWLKRREAKHKEDVYRLVCDIIDIVSSKGQTSDNFIPIIHVRDQLIPFKERDFMKKLWEDAVIALESDSRIRREVQEVEGEEYMGWRWLANPLPNDASKKKVWQGQAFDTMEGSVNSLPHSPTSCLKIRHMFDAYSEDSDDWVTQVVNALLEKCGEAKILHVVVDTQSREGCVYMKCASPFDAGIAYRALHGSWFDKNLVTVKYIREKRYLERFPDSANSTQPLQPSYTK